MKKHEKAFDKVWDRMVRDTNKFIKDNPDVGMYSLQHIENIADHLALSGAWLYDRINGRSGVSGCKGYYHSMTKKIRRALGFTV